MTQTIRPQRIEQRVRHFLKFHPSETIFQEIIVNVNFILIKKLFPYIPNILKDCTSSRTSAKELWIFNYAYLFIEDEMI